MRISLVTLAVGKEYRHSVAPGLEGKQQYCRRHGYDFISAGDEAFDKSRAPAWSKISLVQKVLPYYDRVFLSDADVVLMNHNVRLEDLFEQHLSNEEHHIAMCRDMLATFSTGNMLLENHPWTFEMLTAIWNNRCFLHDPWWEQAAFLDLHKRNVLDARRHVNIAIPRAFNSFPARYGSPIQPELTYESGDFLIHHVNTWNPRLHWHMRLFNVLRQLPPPLAKVIEKFIVRNGILHYTRRGLRRLGIMEDA